MGNMDKNTGDQLNRAYEAYRQACMDKERVKKELQQKDESYQQQLNDQHREIVSLRSCISLLKSRISAFAGTGGVHVPPQSPKLENADGWKSESASNSFLEQLKASMQREMDYKEQLEIDKLRFLEMEEERNKLESALSSKNEQIQHLINLLKDANDRRDSRTADEMEMRGTNIVQDPSAAAPALNESTRQGVERIFSDLKEEFSRICKLTREQSSQLNTFFEKEIASELPMQFSMPVQCTDEENEEAQTMQKPNTKTVRSRFAPITPRGLGPDDELSVSVESLSNLSVKFPPSNESEFLKSSTDSLPVLTLASKENQVHTESPLHPKNFNTARCSPPYSPHSPRTVCHLDNNLLELETTYRGMHVPAAEDSSLFSATKSPVGKCTNDFNIPDIPDADEFTEATGRTVRGPQQSVWKPLPQQDNDLPVPSGGKKWDQHSSNMCEFCQAVFPPASISEDFLRHLNSHFNKQS